MANTYDRGDTVRLSASFAASGVAFDPATVMAFIRNPMGSVATWGIASMTKAATGAYYIDYVPSMAPDGNEMVWRYRYEGTPAPGAAAGEGAFILRPTYFL